MASRETTRRRPLPQCRRDLTHPRPDALLVAVQLQRQQVRITCAAPSATELPGQRATPLQFRKHAPHADVLHLACHGRAELDEPLQSGLLLAMNFKVVLGELMEIPLQVRLAVLSACETALPGTDLPDEVIGLPTGLLQAGSPESWPPSGRYWTEPPPC